MRRLIVLALSLSLAATAAAGQPMPAEHALLRELTAQVSPERQGANIARLVDFGARHTLSDTASSTGGIGAARRWVAAEFAAISKDCGGCLTVETPSLVFTGDRAPVPTEIMDVLPNFDVTMVDRTDRFGRGGDQARILEAGLPAARITEANGPPGSFGAYAPR